MGIDIETFRRLRILRPGEAEADPKPRRKPRHDEERLQAQCVRWFRLTYRREGYIALAIPNGGSRNRMEAANMKRAGVLAGAADLLLVARRRVMFVEMKTARGRQADTQKDFQHRVEALGFGYVICRSLDQFTAEVGKWLAPDNGDI